MATEDGGSESPSTTTIDPRGNLFLIAGEAKQPILVTSHVLQLSSEVFRVMLGLHFKRKEFAEHSSHDFSSYKLPLPEDEPEALVILCSVLHHKYRAANKSMSMDLLKSVAALADKYDCASALYHPATVWLEAKVPEATSPGFESLLAVAIQLDTPLIFTKTSRELIHGWDGSYKKLVNKDEVD